MAVYEALLLNTVVPQIQAAQAGDSYVMVVNATTPALRITQTGTGNALEVEDSANPDATPFVVSAAGDVGIGTSAPAYKLEVNGGSSDAMSLFNSTNANGAHLRFAASGTVKSYIGGAPGFLGSGTADDLGIRAVGSVLFATNGSGVDMTLDASGNLGLGVTPNSSWNAGKTFQIGATGVTLWDAGGDQAIIGSNFYYNSGYKYLGTGNATFYQQTVGQHRWHTAASGTAGNAITFTQAMTLDASGNLVIGNTSANTKLEIAGNNTGVTANNTLRFTDLDTSTEANQQIGKIEFYSSDSSGSGANVKAYIGAFAEDTTPDAYLAFATGDSGAATERARITSGGDLLVNTQTRRGSARQTIYQNSLFITGDGLAIEDGNATTGGAFIGFFDESGTKIGSVSRNAAATVAYNTSSDYRLKDNPQPLTNSGAFIDALKPKTWDWKADGSKGVGFIAHEVQEVSPGTVLGAKDAVDADGKPVMQAMEYGSAEFIANIVAELQSLRARVAQLEAK